MSAPNGEVLDTDISTTQRIRDVRKSFIIVIGMKTPVTSRMEKAPRPLSSTPEWPLKTFDSPNTTGVIEGTVPGSAQWENNLSNKTMFLGRYQKSWRNPAVTKEANLMAKQYAVEGDVFQDNVKDKTLELHRDIEATALTDQESVVPVANSTASQTRAIARWISNANGRFTDAGTTPAAGYRTPSSSIIPNISAASQVTEDNIQNLMMSVAIARQDTEGDFWGVCSPSMRLQFTSFTRTDPKGTSSSTFPVRRFDQKPGPEIHMTVTKYVSDFGEVDLMTSFLLDSQNQTAGQGGLWFLMLDMDMLEIGYAQGPMFLELPPDGANRRGMIDALYVMEVLNPQAHAKIISGGLV